MHIIVTSRKGGEGWRDLHSRASGRSHVIFAMYRMSAKNTQRLVTFPKNVNHSRSGGEGEGKKGGGEERGGKEKHLFIVYYFLGASYIWHADLLDNVVHLAAFFQRDVTHDNNS